MNNMHIAAHARSEGLVLVTNNMGAFARIPALEAQNWLDTAQKYRSLFSRSLHGSHAINERIGTPFGR